MIIRLHELNTKNNKEKLRYIRGIIYKITNIKNNKSYIAITTRSLIDVIGNKTEIGNKKLNDDINKYSAKSFIVEILEHSKTSEELNELKKKYIKELKSNTEEFGYNKRVSNEHLERKLKITKDVAQKKLDELGRQFNIDVWEGTGKPVQVSCKFCGVTDVYSSGSSLFVEDSRYFEFRECRFCGNLYSKVSEPINRDLVGFILHSKTDGKFNYYVTKWENNDSMAIISCKECDHEQSIEKGILVNRLMDISCNNCIKIKYNEEKETRDKLYAKKNKYRNLQIEILDKKKHASNIRNKIIELDKKANDANIIIKRNLDTINYIKNDFENALEKAREQISLFIGNEELIGRTDFNENLINIIDSKRIFINSNKMVDEFIMNSICEYKTEKIKSKIFYRFIDEKQSYPKNKLEEVVNECEKWIEIYNNNLIKYDESYVIYIDKLEALTEKEEVVNVKKYEFTGKETCIEYYDMVNTGYNSRKQTKVVTLKQIRRINDGLIGGCIQSESNLSHLGECFVTDNAMVFEDAKVTGNSMVKNEAVIYGNVEIKENASIGLYAELHGNVVIAGSAIVDGNARIYDNALIMDEAIISGGANVYGDAVICEAAKIDDNAVICGKAIICENVKIAERNIIKGYTLVGNEMII